MKKNKIFGISICLIISIFGYLLGKIFPLIGAPVIAMFTGMILYLVYNKNIKKFNDGIKFTSKKILQLAVVLLGFGMNFKVIVSMGIDSLPIIISTISTALIISFIMHKILKIESNIATLIGVGSAICGGSAIAATAPVIKADNDEVAQSISVIFLFNVIAAIIFPSIGSIIGLSNEGFGIFAGTAINDTSSVTAAASSWDSLHGANSLETATVVKLTRTLAIIPITLCLGLYKNRKNNSELSENKGIFRVIPKFIILFILLAVITTVFTPNYEMVNCIRFVSKFCIIMAMSAIGLSTDIINLFKSGGKPILMGLICWISIAIVSLLVQNILGYL